MKKIACFILILVLFLQNRANSGVYFDGDDRLFCDKGPELDKYFTLSAQIKTLNDNEETQVIISRGIDSLASPIYEMRIGLDPDGGSGFTVFCETTDSGGVVSTVYADCFAVWGNCMELNVPYQIGCVLTDRGDLTPWINGESFTPLTGVNATDQTGSWVYIGMDHYFGNPARDTTISDATIWHTYLSNSQMQSLGFSSMRSYIVDTTFLAGRWPLDDLEDGVNVGTERMQDRSGGGNFCQAASSAEGGTSIADWVRYK